MTKGYFEILDGKGQPYPRHKRRAHFKSAACLFLFVGLISVQGVRWKFGDQELPQAPRGTILRRLLESNTSCNPNAICLDLHGLNTTDQKCTFVETTCDCANEEGFLQYNQWIYCSMGHVVPLAMILLCVWLVFLFAALAVTADDYFCPSLVVISKVLHLSPNVAGVTFLAFGNGAPDLFSALAALQGGGDPALGLGGLLGAGVFVTTIVVGTISITKPFKAMKRPFLRDALFYLAGVLWLFFILRRGEMYLGEAIGFIGFWLVYVGVVIASSAVYKKQKLRSELAKTKDKPLTGLKVLDITQDVTLTECRLTVNDFTSVLRSDTAVSFTNALTPTEMNPSFTPDDSTTPAETSKETEEAVFHLSEEGEDNSAFEKDDIPTTEPEKALELESSHRGSTAGSQAGEEVEEPVNYWSKLGRSLIPIDLEEWPEMKWYIKAFAIFQSPYVFIINLVCPVVNYEVDNNGWHRLLYCLQMLIAPTMCAFLIQQGTVMIGGVLPVYGLTLIIGAAVAVLIYFTTTNEEVPKWHDAFGFVSFFIALVFIYTVANELVSLLTTFGLVFSISEAILGLTLLAWGNSIGDWVSNTLMARQGFARMGFAACFGGPFFNLMLGFGLPMVISMGKVSATSRVLVMSAIQLVLTSTLMFSVLSSMVFLVVSKFKVNRPYGGYLICLYVTFLTVAILTETGVMLQSWTP